MARILSRAWPVALVLAAAALVVAPRAASLESDVDAISVRSLDNRDGNLALDLTYVGDADVADVSLNVDGEDVDATVTDVLEQQSTSVAVVLDTSEDTPNGTFNKMLDAAALFTPGASAIDDVSVVTTGFGNKVRLENETDPEVVAALYPELERGDTNTLYGAALQALELLEEAGEDRHLLLFSLNENVGLTPGYTELSRTMEDLGVQLHVIELEGADTESSDLSALVGERGGSRYIGTDEEFSEAAEQILLRMESRYLVEASGVGDFEGELVPLFVSVGDAKAAVSFRPGVVSVGSANLTYVAPPAEREQFLGSNGRYIVGGFAAFAVFAILLAIGLHLLRDRDGLDGALKHYNESYGAPAFDVDPADGLVTNSALQSAVDMTGRIAEKQGLSERIDNLLQRANLAISPGEALFFYVAFLAIAVAITFFLTGNLLVTLFMAAFALLAPNFIVDFLAKRRKKKFESALPDMLTLLAGTLRAGYSISQAVEAVSNEQDGPMGDELRRAVTEARLGKPLETALDNVADRTGSEDFRWAVMAIAIQREVGGNLAELLNTVAETMVQRERLRRDISALTAEGRMSAVVLVAMPPGLALIMYFLNREYVELLFSGWGLALLLGGIFSMFAGSFWMKKVITIEV